MVEHNLPVTMSADYQQAFISKGREESAFILPAPGLSSLKTCIPDERLDNDTTVRCLAGA